MPLYTGLGVSEGYFSTRLRTTILGDHYKVGIYFSVVPYVCGKRRNQVVHVLCKKHGGVRIPVPCHTYSVVSGLLELVDYIHYIRACAFHGHFDPATRSLCCPLSSYKRRSRDAKQILLTLVKVQLLYIFDKFIIILECSPRSSMVLASNKQWRIEFQRGGASKHANHCWCAVGAKAERTNINHGNGEMCAVGVVAAAYVIQFHRDPD